MLLPTWNVSEVEEKPSSASGPSAGGNQAASAHSMADDLLPARGAGCSPRLLQDASLFFTVSWLLILSLNFLLSAWIREHRLDY